MKHSYDSDCNCIKCTKERNRRLQQSTQSFKDKSITYKKRKVNKEADIIDGYNRDDIGESPDY